jgi:uncharacterized membrane protein YdjX (TVP38/TMEM64 family)
VRPATLARLALAVLILAGIAVAATHWKEFSVENLQSRIAAFGVWAPLLLIAAYCLAASAIVYSWLGHFGMEAASGQGSWLKLLLMALPVLAVIAFLPRMIKYLNR